MYKKPKYEKTTISLNDSVEGETIEQKMERVVNNNEAITDGAPIIFTERKDGVLPGYDIRTDRFEIAIDAMDKVTGSHRAKRSENQKKVVEDYNKKIKQNDGGAEPTQGKTSTSESTE